MGFKVNTHFDFLPVAVDVVVRALEISTAVLLLGLGDVGHGVPVDVGAEPVLAVVLVGQVDVFGHLMLLVADVPERWHVGVYFGRVPQGLVLAVNALFGLAGFQVGQSQFIAGCVGDGGA